jgi:hypothetical protein
MPAAGERADVIRGAQMCVSNKLTTPDGLARLGKLVAARYAHPVITRQGDHVIVDAGVVAGTLTVFRGTIQIDDSPYVVRGEWAASEVVRFLELGMAQVPDAATYEAKVLIPKRSLRPEWRYTYDRADDRIRAESENRGSAVYVTEKLGGDLGRVRSLHTSDLAHDDR